MTIIRCDLSGLVLPTHIYDSDFYASKVNNLEIYDLSKANKNSLK